MTYEVFVTEKAVSQLEAAAQWWAEHHSPAVAERWHDGFIKAIESLKTNPERWSLARESKAFPMPIRELHFGLGKRKTHRAIFCIRPDRVVVYAIRHHSQSDLSVEDV